MGNIDRPEDRFDCSPEAGKVLAQAWQRMHEVGAYGYCPSISYYGSDVGFINHLSCLTRFLRGGKRFIDLGCGVGELLRRCILPRFAGSIVGVELDGPTIQIAAQYLKGTGIQLIHGDLREVSLRGFDRIYTFRPIHIRNAYEGTIIDRMDRGALWFEVSDRGKSGYYSDALKERLLAGAFREGSWRGHSHVLEKL